MMPFNNEIIVFEDTLQKLLQDAYCKGYERGGNTNFDIDWQKEGWNEAGHAIQTFKKEKEEARKRQSPQHPDFRIFD